MQKLTLENYLDKLQIEVLPDDEPNNLVWTDGNTLRALKDSLVWTDGLNQPHRDRLWVKLSKQQKEEIIRIVKSI